MRFLADQDVYWITVEWLRKEGYGVILLRITPTTVEEVHRELRRLLQEYTEEQLRDLFCVVEPDRYRIRRLRSS